MAIDESEILLGAALMAASPYALEALFAWSRRFPAGALQELMHRIGAGMHRHG